MPAGSPLVRRRGRRAGRFLLLIATLLLSFAVALVAGAADHGTTGPRLGWGRVAHAESRAWVDTGGDCLVLRSAPGLGSGALGCLDHGTELGLLEGSQSLDGFTWQYVAVEGQTGWVANFYITTDPGEVQELVESPGAPLDGTTPGVGASVEGLPVPPVGGLTFGVPSEGDPEVLASGLGYEVAGIWRLEVGSQVLRQFLPGAPGFVNTLSSIPPGGVVVVRRAGELVAVGPPPEASLTVAGSPRVLPVPPVGGVTQGVSGTTDPRFLVEAQPFAVQSVAYFHVGSQQWLVYLPGAPAHAQSLQQGQLRVNSVVSVTRAADGASGEGAPGDGGASDGGVPDGGVPSDGVPSDGVPPDGGESSVGDSFEVSLTYYYCVPGSNPASIGDGGGYCGGMANGEVVHEGAAACAAEKLGERFTIEGDPTGRVYTCEDTGGSVLNDHRDIWFMHSDEGYAWWVEVGARARITVVAE